MKTIECNAVIEMTDHNYQNLIVWAIVELKQYGVKVARGTTPEEIIAKVIRWGYIISVTQGRDIEVLQIINPSTNMTVAKFEVWAV